MPILIATTPGTPQVNGVVRTLTSLANSGSGLGEEIAFLTPEGFPSMGVAHLSGPADRAAESARDRPPYRGGFPEAIHIATEGPIGGRRGPIAAATVFPSRRRTRRAFQNMSRSDTGIPLALGLHGDAPRFHASFVDGHGCHRLAAGRTCRAWLSQAWRLDAWRRPPTVQPRTGQSSFHLPRPIFMDPWAGWRSKRILRAFLAAGPARHQGRDLVMARSGRC
jgi:hypothetical protein